jgi:DNA-binding NtrC family response regulator
MAAQPHIVLVDDDPDTLELTELLLAHARWRVTAATSAREALAVIDQMAVDCVVTDVNMPGSDGFSLLDALRQGRPEIPVILLTSYVTLDDAVRAVDRGAMSYLPKPATARALIEAVQGALEHAAAVRAQTPDGSPRHAPDAVVGRSPAIVALYGTVARAAMSAAPVLVRGETGVGKEWVARAIHRYGPRSGGAFVPVNCSAFAEGTLESELFGHARGGFTGAVAARKGLLQSAHRGTLFLDEVGDTPLRVQAELLRVLQDGEVRPVGSDEVVKVDARVVCATHRDLDRMVAEGRFREDLLFRLRVIEVTVPPLRARRDDIPLLAEHFLAHGPDAGRKRFAPEALVELTRRAWPGNVRELQSAVLRAKALAPGEVILPRDLPPVVGDEGVARAAVEAPMSLAGLWESLFAHGVPSLEELELSYVRAVVARLGGNKTQAAEALGVDRKTIRRILARGGDDEA